MDCGMSSSFCSGCGGRSSSFKISLLRSPVIPIFVLFLLVPSLFFCQARSLETAALHATNQTFRPRDELQKLKMIRAHLKGINKPPLKTIQSPDGDLIDCVLSHQQPAFDHPLLKGQKPLDPPKRPNGQNSSVVAMELFQLWRMSGEVCPEGTVPIRRMSEADMLRASSIQTFGKKVRSHIRIDASNINREYAVGRLLAVQYYGAQAVMNVWAPLTLSHEFSLAQFWVSFLTNDNVETTEAGWQICPSLYGDSNVRFFIYWTADAYQSTGCYNLLCAGFVQTSNVITIGGSISPLSMRDGTQVEITLLVWKDLGTGNWWLEYSGIQVGYWPSILFTGLRDHANMVEFGGEILNSSPGGVHTITEMGSGKFPDEGYRKAAYFRNLQVVDTFSNIIPCPDLELYATYPLCYNISGGVSDNSAWGNHFYYGGSGRNSACT